MGYIITFLLTLFIPYNKGINNYTFTQLPCPYEYDPQARINVFTYTDEMPKYPGGEEACLMFIMKRLIYPEQENFQASFRIQFIVDIDGCPRQAEILNKKENELTLVEKELLKVIYMMPKWMPGKCSGKVVPVRVFFPLYL